MGGQGLGDRQDRTIGGRRKASEIEKNHAIEASPRAGTSTPGRRQLVARTLQQVEGSLTTGGYPMWGQSLNPNPNPNLSPKFEFLCRRKAILFSGCYATRQGTNEIPYRPGDKRHRGIRDTH